MAIRWTFLASFIILTICGCHGRGSKSESAPSPAAFFISQKYWCTAGTQSGTAEGDELFDEIFAFSEDGVLKVLTSELDQFNRLKRNENGELQTREDQTLRFRVDGSNLYTTLPNDSERMSEFTVVQENVGGKPTTCFQLKAAKSLHCACDLVEKK